MNRESGFARAVSFLLQVVVQLVRRLARAGWEGFLRLTLWGKVASIFVALFVTGWLVSKAGVNSVGGELAKASWTVFSLLLTALIMRYIWTRYTQPRRNRHPPVRWKR